MKTVYEMAVFKGTGEEAALLHRSLKKSGLTGAEEFVLLRYLDLPIPWELDAMFRFMDCRRYHMVIKAVLDRLPDDAKQRVDAE